MENLDLKKIIDTLCYRTNLHVCIHDISGILNLENLSIDIKNKIHSKTFCDIAKSTQLGFDVCIHCKTSANDKAVNEKKSFSGYCSYGLFEFVKPVLINNIPVCIIYIGNILKDKYISTDKIIKTSEKTKVKSDMLIKELENSEPYVKNEIYGNIAGIIEAYIKFAAEKNNFIQNNNYEQRCAQKVESVIEYIDLNFDKNISLKKLSKLYFINEKYLGCLFKSKTGMTFREYLNKVRLDNAAKYLSYTDRTIINISIDCGFSNVTYFNRMFMKRYNMTPTQFRKNIKKP
ncbi:MAG: helix-turn-helix domain-containing protein [Clostridia bacterium]|nr:helix-turn-helix domain-containing protein [Clostridia bacterium]